MGNEVKNGIVIHTGFACGRAYFFETSLPLPEGYELVLDGKTRPKDMIMVLLPPIPKKQTKRTRQTPNGDVLIKSQWEILEERHIGKPARDYRAIIRKRAAVCGG